MTTPLPARLRWRRFATGSTESPERKAGHTQLFTRQADSECLGRIA